MTLGTLYTVNLLLINVIKFTVQLTKPSPLINFEALAKAQPADDELNKLNSTTSTLKLERLPMPMCNDTLLCDTCTGTPRPYVPEHFRHIVFNSLHALSHPRCSSYPATIDSPVRFDHVHIDLVGPLPTSHSCTYLFTCVDRFTRWPEAIPIPDSTANMVAQAFISGWVFRFGVPSTNTTDRGQQFESTLWRHLMHLLNTHRI